jgi:hypothetical protein
VGLFIWYAIIKIKHFDPSNIESYANNSREAYAWIADKSKQKRSLVSVFTLEDLPHWEPDIAVGIDFYLAEDLHPQISSPYFMSSRKKKGNQVYKLAQELRQSEKFEFIFLLIGPAPPMPMQQFNYLNEELGVMTKQFDNYEVLSLDANKGEPVVLLYQYLNMFQQAQLTHSGSYKIDELLVYLACLRKDAGGVKNHFERLSQKIDLSTPQHKSRFKYIKSFVQEVKCSNYFGEQ